MAIITMSSFWTDLGVTCGNQNANNWYDCFYGITFGDGFVCANATDFFDHLLYNRYDFFLSYIGIDSEYDFYKNTDDPNIYNFLTFYEYAPSYFPANCGVANNFVIAFRNNSSPYKSFDGINWTTITTDALSDYSVNANCSASKPGSFTLMGGNTNVIRYNWGSDTWENFTTIINIQDMAYDSDNDLFIGITREVTTNQIHISTDDGETWTTTTSVGNYFDCIGYSYNQGKYYAANRTTNGKRVMTSTNGTAWTGITSATGAAATTDAKYLNCIEFEDHNIYFIPAAPTSGDEWIIQTADLMAFTQSSTAFGSDWKSVGFDKGGDNVVMLGETTTPGAWETIPSLAISSAPQTYQYTDAKYFTTGNVFIAGTRAASLPNASKKILYSTDDGNNWIQVSGTTGNISNILVIE